MPTGTGVAVVAKHFWAAKLGRDALKIEWTPPEGGGVDTTKQMAEFHAQAKTTGAVFMEKGKVETALRQVRIGRHTAAVLDPPRAGCEPAALAEIIRLGLDRVVYISCEPSTHARDLAALVRGGYRVRRAAIVDMFPHTYHIESVALLER